MKSSHFADFKLYISLGTPMQNTSLHCLAYGRSHCIGTGARHGVRWEPGGGRGADMSSASFQESGNKTATTVGIVLMQYFAHKSGHVPIINMAKVNVLCRLSGAPCLSGTVRGGQIYKWAFRVALDFLQQCFASDAQAVKHHDFASRSPVNCPTG